MMSVLLCTLCNDECPCCVHVRHGVVDVVTQRIYLDSAVGSDSIPFRPLEFYGWAVPVVSNQKYQFRFGSGIDWTTATIRYSEPQYIDDSEWLYLYSNYSTYKYQFSSTYQSQVRRRKLGRANHSHAVGSRHGSCRDNVYPSCFVSTLCSWCRG